MEFSRWLDEKNNSLEEINKILTRKRNDEKDEEGSSTKYVEWNIENTVNGKIRSGDKDIEYKSYNYSVQIENKDSSKSGDAVQYTGKIIAYLLDDKVRYIISKNTGAQTLLRQALGYTTERKVITDLTQKFSSDFFMWLIKKVYFDDSIFGNEDETQNASLVIELIKGFRGNSQDFSSTVSAKGQTVMKLISTISFLIESSNLKQLILSLFYKEHETIDIKLKENGIVGYDDDAYQGILLKESEDKRISEMMLILFIEVLPIIRQQYNEEVSSNLWNTEIKTQFISTLAKELEKNERIEDFKK